MRAAVVVEDTVPLGLGEQARPLFLLLPRGPVAPAKRENHSLVLLFQQKDSFDICLALAAITMS
jgi:hypothetical protein